MKLTKWLNRIVIIFALWISFLPGGEAQIRTITLEDAHLRARQHYPLLRQNSLIRQSESVAVQNLNKGYLPQLSLQAQGTYQSDVTQLAISLPGAMAPPDKDQYKATADFSQLLFDGGALSESKKVQRAAAETEVQRLEVELYKLRERIDQLYLNILYTEQQQKQIALVQQDLDTGINRLEARVRYGVALRSGLDILKAERLKTRQRSMELHAVRAGLISALATLTGLKLDMDTDFQVPQPPTATGTIRRPELKLFEKQDLQLQQQERLIMAKNLPKASFFGQGGYGRPELNFLKNEFDWYYLAGIRLSWNLAPLYSQAGERRLLNLNRQTIETQKETFLLNTRSQLEQQSAEITRLEELLATDREIIILRERVKNASRSQLENGVITASDFLQEVNAEDQARQAEITHRIQLLQARITLQNITGI